MLAARSGFSLPYAAILMACALVTAAEQPSSELMADRLLRDMQGNDHDTRYKAADALGKIGPSALPKILPLLKHADDEVRQYAVVAIGEMGPAAKQAIPQLIEMLKDVEDEVRYSAADALAAMGPAAAPAIAPLADLFSDPDETTRECAAEALGAIGPVAQSKLLAMLKDSRRRNEFAYVCAALGCLRPVDQASVTEVTRLLRHQDPEIRLAAITALAEMGTAASNAVPHLIALYRREHNVRWAIGSCLARIRPGTPEAVKAIRQSLRDHDATVRLFALVAFSRLDLPIKTRLTEFRHLTKDENALVRQMVLRSLRDMKEHAQPLLPELRALQNDPDKEVRLIASQLVRTLTAKSEDDIE